MNQVLNVYLIANHKKISVLLNAEIRKQLYNSLIDPFAR